MSVSKKRSWHEQDWGRSRGADPFEPLRGFRNGLDSFLKVTAASAAATPNSQQPKTRAKKTSFAARWVRNSCRSSAPRTRRIELSCALRRAWAKSIPRRAAF